MLWALLFSIIFGSSNNLMTIPKFNKYAKKNIEDKERLAQVLEYRKEIKSEKKAFHKKDKKALKTYDQLFADPTIPNDSVYSFFSKHIEDEKTFLTEGLDLTIKGKSYITESEWQSIVKDFNDDHKKLIKYHDKTRKKVNKHLEKLRSLEMVKTKNLENDINRFSTSTHQCLEKRIAIQLPYNEVLLQFTSSRPEYIEVIDSLIASKYEMLETQLQLRQVLMDNLSNSEFKKMTKPIIKID